MRNKIAFVCQRYGLEVTGGAELECRQYAEALLPWYDVEVFTTCALDYVTWANHYPEGTETLNGVTVHRFQSVKERDLACFGEMSEKVFHPHHSDQDEEQWLNEQGPVCPELVTAIATHHKEYQAILFMTCLYYPTVMGLTAGIDNAFLIPTVHDEPPIYLRVYDKAFAGAGGFIWNTEEEKRFAEKRFPDIIGKPGVVVGVGIEMPNNELPRIPEYLSAGDYLLYAGRIDIHKSCDRMLYCFRWYREHKNPGLKLVLIGKVAMDIPESPDIVNMGFVSEEMKFALMRDAKALMLFSQFESLSMVVLESMAMGRPVLVNGECEVLKGHCIRSGAGLYFENDREFVGALDYLMNHPEEYETMRENGRRYVQENYRWERITEKIRKLVEGKI